MKSLEIRDEILRAFYPFRLPIKISDDMLRAAFGAFIYYGKNGDEIYDRYGEYSELSKFAKKHRVKFHVLPPTGCGIVQMESA